MKRFTQEDLIDGTPTGTDGVLLGKSQSVSAISKARSSSRLDMRASTTATESRTALLSRALEMEIIPRLVQAHRTEADTNALSTTLDKRIGEAELEQFYKLVISSSDCLAEDFVGGLRSRGISVEALYLNLLAPAAQRLHTSWEQDLCGFMEVTLGMGRLQQLLREISPAFCHSTDRPDNGRRLLLLQGPGQQQPLGLMLVAEFFYRDGWDVTFGPNEDGEDPAKSVKREWFDVVGFSQTKESHTAKLAECIQRARKASLNPGLLVFVGDPVSQASADYAVSVGADALSNDVRALPSFAEKLLSKRI